MSNEKALLRLKIRSEYVQILVDTLSPFLDFKPRKKGMRFTIGKTGDAKCYLVRTGMVTISRQPDDILLGIFEAPSLRGIIRPRGGEDALYTLKVVQDAEIAVIEFDKFYTLLAAHQLWETYARHLELLSTSLTEYLLRLLPPTAYEIVRLQLYELMSEPEAVRDLMSADMYIRSRTRLSRSSVMRILSELKAGGYILLEAGHLRGIVKIPERF